MGNLTVTPSPHIAGQQRTATIMRDVVIALVPALLAATLIFGYRSLLVTAVCILSCVAFEYLARTLMKRENTIGDWSAVVTGMLLAFNLPVTIPLWIAVVGSFFAIVIVKQVFGGIGQNFANPALTARIFLAISFANQMTHWTEPFHIDAVSSATPLAHIAGADTLSLFLGTVPGCLGETSALALLIGGVYLVVRKVIMPTIPLVYIGTVFVLSWIFGSDPLNQILAGGVMIGAIFMATDYATSPVTRRGQVIFAFGCGLLTALIRIFGSYPEGISYSILFMNILVPFIDRITKLKPLGTKPERQKGSRRAIIVPTVVLTVIGAGIAAILALTYNLTGIGDLEAGLNSQQRQEFASQVIPGCEVLEQAEYQEDFEGLLGVYTDQDRTAAALHIQVVGYAGRSDPIEALVGIDAGGTVTGVAIVTDKETPGLGTRIEDPDYLDGFVGISGSAQEVDTITGATISSTALRDGVDFALGIFEQVSGEVLS